MNNIYIYKYKYPVCCANSSGEATGAMRSLTFKGQQLWRPVKHVYRNIVRSDLGRNTSKMKSM